MFPFQKYPLPWSFSFVDGEFGYYSIKDKNGEQVPDWTRSDALEILIPLLTEDQKKKLGQGMPNLALEDSYHDEWWRFKDKSTGKEYTVKCASYDINNEKDALKLLEGILNV